jgi:hypothetical protein
MTKPQYLANTDDKMTLLADPLFVIATSLEIIKHLSGNEKIVPEIKRIESALTKIGQIIK